MWKWRSGMLVIVLAVMLINTVGCSGQTDTGTSGLAMAGMDQMPADVQSAPVTVQQAYQFAVANPDTLQHIPCYCGCGNIGHTSNYACYVSGQEESGKPQFDDHALGCSICVDITQDVMRLQRQGQPLAEIRAYIDQTYVKYGSSNIPAGQ